VTSLKWYVKWFDLETFYVLKFWRVKFGTFYYVCMFVAVTSFLLCQGHGNLQLL